MKRTVHLTILMAGGVELSSGSFVPVGFHVDLARLSAKFDKMLRVLNKECPNTLNAYIVSVLVVAFFEVAFGCELSVETLADLRSIIVDAVESNDAVESADAVVRAFKLRKK
jgi:hypothetical protein